VTVNYSFVADGDRKKFCLADAGEVDGFAEDGRPTVPEDTFADVGRKGPVDTFAEEGLAGGVKGVDAGERWLGLADADGRTAAEAGRTRGGDACFAATAD
jgi:hypothetical protein